MNSTLLDALLKDSSYKFIDNVKTFKKENLPEIITAAFISCDSALKVLEGKNMLQWGKYKDTRVKHLLRLEPFSRLHLPIGGGANMINATKEDHGPSWRMIVSLTPETEAFGVYPGGQSGNPGSRYYDNFINNWVEGKYYPLWLMKFTETSDQRIKWKMRFKKLI
jgi:penicillin amidase